MMSPRNLILLGVAALAGSALLLGFTVAGAPGEDALRACLAEFLEVDPDTMEVWVRSTDRHGTIGGGARSEDGTRLTFGLREVDGKLRVVRMTRRTERTEEDIGIDRARAKAVAFAESKYERWAPDMVETEGKRTPSGPYIFNWTRFTKQSYETGDSVWLMSDSGTGEVILYVAHYATHDIPPRTDAEEATRIALEHLEEQVVEGAAIEVTDTRCVLSMPWSQGPVWFIRFMVTVQEDMRHPEEVMVDGLTGDILTLDDLP